MNESRTYSDTGIGKANLQDYSVSEISSALKKTVEDRFGHVRIRGEITGYRGPHSSGHAYFALKDDRARIEAVIWRGVFGRLPHKPEEGLEVIATGKLTTYPGSSKYQIVIESIEPAGAGALMALLEERKKKMEAEGLFAPERKQLLPFMPKRIGVVTSPTGAVIRDILHRIKDRFPIHVMVWPVRVQGETTGVEVSRAIVGFNHMPPTEQPDVIIVARGGGSIEDLWGFNDEAVVRAAADSDIPLVSAVGHETDWTLIDHAADVRAPTPTGAAELVVPVKVELEAGVASYRARLQAALQSKLGRIRSELLAATRGLSSPDSLLALPRRRLDEASGRLGRGLELATRAKATQYANIAARLGHHGLTNLLQRNGERLSTLEKRARTAFLNSMTRKTLTLASLAGRLGYRGLETLVMRGHERLSGFERRIDSAFENRIVNTRTRLDQYKRILDSLSYKAVLQRGYAVVRDGTDKALGSASSLASGDAFSVEFKDGRVDAIAASAQSVQKPKKVSKTGKPDGDNQGSLF